MYGDYSLTVLLLRVIIGVVREDRRHGSSSDWKKKQGWSSVSDFEYIHTYRRVIGGLSSASSSSAVRVRSGREVTKACRACWVYGIYVRILRLGAFRALIGG